MSDVNKQLLEALKDLFASYKQLADSGDAGNWRIEDFPEGKQAIEAIAAADQETSSVAGWQDFNDGFKAGAEEMRDGLLQLCKDFSDRQNRPYMGDVLAQVDSLFDLIVLETPRSLERKAEQAQRPCQYCDGTGDVHSPTGEWLGACDCESFQQAQQAEPVVRDVLSQLHKRPANGLSEGDYHCPCYLMGNLQFSCTAKQGISPKITRQKAAQQQAVPQGYALVPIEPTQAMLCAGQKEWLESAGADPSFDVYRSMLSAAQKGGK